MLPPLQQVDEQARLEQLRYDADIAIARALRGTFRDASSRANAIRMLDRLSGTLQRDIAIYRRRLLAEIGTSPALGRRLRLVPTSTDDTASPSHLRPTGGDSS